MSDGAHLGVGAEAAMKAVLGGEKPTERESAGQMRDRIMRITRAEATTYDGVSTYIAKLIIEAFMADPALASVPTERVYAKDADGRTDWSGVVTPDLWDVLKPRLSADDLAAIEGMSGFMWGWAVNAARRCVELPPVPNPAIIEIGR